MAESFYKQSNAASSSPAQIPQTPQSPTLSTGPPPPPPPPKPYSHERSQSSTSQVQTNPTYQAYSQPNSSSPPPPPPPPHSPPLPAPPPVPSSPSHAHALAKQQQQQQQRYQQQQQPQHRSPHDAQNRPSHEQYTTNQPPHSFEQRPTQFSRQSQMTPAPSLDSGWLPDGLTNKSTADLQPILSNPELLAALSHQHPSYKASQEPLQKAITDNLALAQQVAQLEAQVKHLRDQTGQLLINHTSLQTQWRRKQGEMDDALSPWGPRAMYQKLVSSITEQESLLRAVYESFLEGGAGGGDLYGNGDGKASEKEVTEWVKRIKDGTTTLEKRREMRARWDEGRVGGWR